MGEATDGTVNELPFSEAIRRRPSMFVGSTGFFGFVNYLVCPVALLLAQRGTKIAVSAGTHDFRIESDAAVPLEELPDGRVAPFETIKHLGDAGSFEGSILNSLSAELDVTVVKNSRTLRLSFERGTRKSMEISPNESADEGTVFRFVPDSSIFEVTSVSLALFESYLRRLSYLHQGVRFSLSCGGTTATYLSERGISDLFDSISAPYQLLHEPIHVIAEEGALQLEFVFAYHSWSEDHLWSFINRGRAVDGGTHEQGLADALNTLYRKLKLPKQPKARRNGVVGVMSAIYPEVVWQGCIKSRIGNPELRELVRSLVVRHAIDWVTQHPDVAAQLQQLQTFQFPDVWYS